MLLLLLSAIGAFGHFVGMVEQVRLGGFIDTETFIAQAKYFQTTGELYSNPLKEGGRLEHFEPASPWYKFPPAYMLAYMPGLGATSIALELQAVETHQQAEGLWRVHVWRYAGTLLLLLLLLRPADRSLPFLLHGAIYGLLFTPMFESLYGLIFDNLLLCGLVVILLSDRLKRQTLAAWIIGGLASLKVFPALLVLWLPIRGVSRWWAHVTFSAGLLLVAGWLVFGADNTLFYFGELLPLLLQEKALVWPGNFSLAGYMMTWWDPEVAMQVFFILKNTLLLITVGVLWRTRKAVNQQLAANQLSLLACMLLLYLPNYWGNYQLILLLPVLTLLADVYKRELWGRGLVVTVIWLLMVFSTDHSGFYVPFHRLIPPPWIQELSGWRPLCPLLLWLMLVQWFLSSQPDEPRVSGWPNGGNRSAIP